MDRRFVSRELDAGHPVMPDWTCAELETGYWFVRSPAPGLTRPVAAFRAWLEKLSQLTKFSLASFAVCGIVSRMTKYDPDLSLLFHALADPTRRSILTRLAETPARVTDLAEPTGLRLPTVMRHLSVLEEAGLITTSKDGRVRTCAIVPEALAPMRTWLDEQRAIWEARLDRLDAFVMNAVKESEE
ncbi:DNA-binding transcriptional ArsR family regulator [Roseibium marinum]|uniref:DNA-binding transcriptional ArsR family regulator n=2 Tax=Roseibium marinum TaxID=281252 RepID=A0A2S3V3I4_9HYPH|nr:DNA-binding transcriptional ArsR family regulator [Roseibium marinum]